MAFQIKKQGGYAALYQDNQRMAPLAYQLARIKPTHPCAQTCIPQFHNAGIDVVGWLVHLWQAWKEQGLDWSFLLRDMQEAKRLNPQVKFLLRVNLTPPHWWMRQNKEELVKYYGVECADLEERALRMENTDKTNDMRASFCSQKWQDEVCKILKAMHQVFVEQGFNDDIFAIQTAYGTCGEWHIYGNYYGDSKSLFEGDYSLPMLNYFRTYLKEKYQTDENLQAAWKNSAVTIETAQLATPEQRKSYREREGFLYRFPEEHMQALDSLKCLQTAAPRAISRFAKCIKETWGRQVLVGTFYGYYFACGDVFGRMLEPHLLFDDENVDYLAAPNAYTANKRGGNAAFLRYCAESMRLNGKLFLSEVDQGFKSYCCYRNEPNEKKYVCADDSEYVAITARNVFESILRGNGAWFFEHQHPEDYGDLSNKTGYWDTPARMDGLRRIRQASEKTYALREKFQQDNDVLIVYDTQSIYHFGPSLTGDYTDLHNTYNHFDMADAIAKSGVGYDTIWLYDLQKCDLSHYKCVLFISCTAMRKTEFEYIQKSVLGGGRTVAFMGETALIVDEKTSEEHFSALVGGALSGKEDAEIEKEDCKVVYIPQLQYDQAFYRALFAGAGAHVYTQGGEVVCAGNGFVMVHTKGIENTRLHLACGDVSVQNGACNTAVYDNHTGERIF